MDSFFFGRNDGTVVKDLNDKDGLRLRESATDNHGNVAGLLAEMRGRRRPLPWFSQEARDQAADVVRETLQLPGRTRRALLRHISRTPYAIVGPCVTLRFVPADGAPSFASAGRAARTVPAFGPFLKDLRAEAKAGRDPIPYASRAVRDVQADRIRTDTETKLTEDERRALLRHVGRTPYRLEHRRIS